MTRSALDANGPLLPPPFPVTPEFSGTENVTAEEGSSVTLVCDTYSNPQVTVSWQKNGEALDLSSGGFVLVHDRQESRLSMAQLQRSIHEAQYSCMVSSSMFGTRTKFFLLTVKGPYLHSFTWIGASQRFPMLAPGIWSSWLAGSGLSGGPWGLGNSTYIQNVTIHPFYLLYSFHYNTVLHFELDVHRSLIKGHELHYAKKTAAFKRGFIPAWTVTLEWEKRFNFIILRCSLY